MTFIRLIAAIALISLAGCMDAPAPSSAPPAANNGNLAPSSGRTGAERQARKDYYRGPRGDI